MKKFWRVLGSTIIVVFFTACILYGLLFLAFELGWTNVSGTVDQDNTAYQNQQIDAVKTGTSQTTIDESQKASLKSLCELKIIATQYPQNGVLMQQVYDQTHSDELLAKMIFVFNLKNNDIALKNSLDNCNSTLSQVSTIIATASLQNSNQNIYAWANTEEWPVITEAITKDKDAINKASDVTQIEPRLLVAPVIVEQLRLYFTEREYFKQFFQPLKILGVTNLMSMGVMSLKEKTAIQIEDNLKDKTSDYYPGSEFEHLLDFKTDDIAKERNDRLTNQHDQYYAYLYGALYIKEVETQWQKAGYPIDDRPEIICTLYNLGFEHSKPNATPQVGGSTLTIGGVDYTFGGLGSEFYYSGELSDIFPYKIKN